MAKKIIQPETQQVPLNNFTADNIDMSKPEYTHCNFYNIESAYFGMNPLINVQALQSQVKQNVPNQKDKDEGEVIRKKMMDYITSVTGFSPEMVERIIDCAEQFMKDNFNDDDVI